MKILVTGFDPFGGDKINPAIEAVKRLPDEINGAEIIKLEIPTVFNKSAEVVRKAIEKENPDYVLNVGQAGGRSGLTPERVAININDGRIPDNEGYQPLGEPIHEDGETAYFTQLPIKAEAKAIRDAGLPASVSNTAGTYVCNHIMYSLLYYINKNNLNIKGGFIHVPYITEQVLDKKNTPYMDLKTITKGLEASIKAIKNYEADIKVSGGKEF